MKIHFPSYQILWKVGLLLLLTALFLEFYSLNPQMDIKRFKSSLIELENKTDAVLSELKTEEGLQKFIQSNKNTEGISFFIYEDKELIYWSCNLINIPEVYENSLFNQALLKLNNGYYAVRRLHHLNKTIIGLIPIHYEYKTPNIYLKNTFNKALQPLYKTTLSFNAQEGHFISNKEGKYLFSLIQTPTLVADSDYCTLIAVLFLLSFLFFIGYFNNYLYHHNTRKHFHKVLAVLGGLFLLRGFMIYFKIPNSIYSLILFQSNLHASSAIFRSLGDYWLNALIIFLTIYTLSSFNSNKQLLNLSKKRILIRLFLGMCTAFGFGLFAFSQIKSLVLNSSFSLQIHIGSSIEEYTIWGYAGASLFLACDILMLRTLSRNAQKAISRALFYKIWIFTALIFAITCLFIDTILVFHIVFITVLGIIQGASHYRTNQDFIHFLRIIVLLLSSFYLTGIINTYSEQKEHQIRLAKAESIIDSNNPRMKAMLETIHTEWNKDDTLLRLFQKPISNENQIKEYLRTKYFRTNWFNYNVHFSICTNKDKLENSKKANTDNNCFEHFSKMLQKANRISNTPFYEITTYKGLSSYLGVLSFVTEEYGEIRLFIELELKPYENEEGYPNLLINKQRKDYNTTPYSFAKYLNNKLRYSSGSFNYYNNFNIFQRKIHNNKERKSLIELDDYTHYIYNVTDNYKIIVSNKNLSFYKKYIAFPYIFFMLFFSIFIILFLDERQWRNFQIPSFKVQIQATLISLITIVFLVLGGASLFYNFVTTQRYYKDAHNEKIKMLRRELFSRITNAKELDAEFTPDLTNKLKKYAGILGADINIYDTYGVLLASSQPEIFSKGLLS
ncbi:MAG: hypothetical protein KGV44_15350, partial [Flavobacteriaceae bacterium]|nr:hypothetical protein [Flavobacteriaceae bacterium]